MMSADEGEASESVVEEMQRLDMVVDREWLVG